MVAYIQPVKMKLVSGNPWARPGIIPMIVVLVFSWIFVCIWLLLGSWVYAFNPLWAITMMASSILYSLILGTMSYKLISDFHKSYEMEITNDEIVLLVKDRLAKRYSTQMVLLDDVKYVEYYPYRDSASMILHSAYTKMEVPLWPLGRRAQDVIDFIEGHGVKVVNVQTDDKIPE